MRKKNDELDKMLKIIQVHTGTQAAAKGHGHTQSTGTKGGAFFCGHDRTKSSRQVRKCKESQVQELTKSY